MELTLLMSQVRATMYEKQSVVKDRQCSWKPAVLLEADSALINSLLIIMATGLEDGQTTHENKARAG